MFEVQPPPICDATSCDDDALVHWQRRLTADEIAAAHALELQRRADRDTPFPDGIPLPDGSEMSHLVHACGDHAIHMDSAALIHQAQCAGPDSTTLPACGCTPEAAHTAPAAPKAATLPAGWVTFLDSSHRQ